MQAGMIAAPRNSVCLDVRTNRSATGLSLFAIT